MFGGNDDYLDSFFSAAYFHHGSEPTAKSDENKKNAGQANMHQNSKVRPHSARLVRLEVPARPISAGRKVRPSSANAYGNTKLVSAVPGKKSVQLPPMLDDYVGTDGGKVKKKKKSRGRKKKTSVHNVLTQLDLPAFERISSQNTYRLVEANTPDTSFETTYLMEQPEVIKNITRRGRQETEFSPLHHLSYNDAFDDLLQNDQRDNRSSPVKPKTSPTKSPVRKTSVVNSPMKRKKSSVEIKKSIAAVYEDSPRESRVVEKTLINEVNYYA